MGDIVKGIGKVVGAIPKGVGHALHTSGIPIVSGAGGMIENAGKGLAGDIPFLKGILPAAGTALTAGLGGLGGLAGNIGKAISAPNILGNAAGKLDLGKVIGAAGGISSIIGQNQQRKSAERYANAGINQRNQLMSKILAPQNYGISQ